MTEYCNNHPQIPTKRKCFNCHEFICRDCQILIKHHYFCNFKCYKKYYSLSFINTTSVWMKKVFELPVFLLRDVRKVSKTVKWSFIFNLFLVAALAITISLLINLKNRLHTLEQRTYFANQNNNNLKMEPGPAKKNHFSIQKPVNGGMVLTNRIDVEGVAENNQIISLEMNGEIEAVTLPVKGKFEFLNIHAKRGNNLFTIKSISESGEVTSLETINIEYNNPTLRYLSMNVARGNFSVPKIALTFDGGYLDNACEEILDILKQRKIWCTFFLTGYFIKKYPAIVNRMVEDGHEVGNHTWSHPHLTEFEEKRVHVTKSTVSSVFLQNQLNKTALAFQACTGRKLIPFWRAPYGEHNLEIREWAAELGYRHIGWTVGPSWENNMDTMDWVADSTLPAYHTADEILDKVLNFGHGALLGASGSIVIMHLGTLRKTDFPHKKLPEIIDGLREKGYELVCISEMLY